MKPQEKIIQILALLSTGQREASVRNYIEYIVFNTSNIKTPNEVVAKTQQEFGLTLQTIEVEDEINWLIENGRISRDNKNLQLTETAKQEFSTAISAHEKQTLEQYKIFKKEIQNINKGKLPEDMLLNMHSAFKAYLYDAFLEYGRSATAMFTTSVDETNTNNNNIFLSKALATVKTDGAKKLLENYINTFPSIITVKQLTYLEQLADKAESFFALGLSKELYHELQSIAPLDWTLFLDTNVLYSILNIRSNSENNAIKSILEINKSYPEVFSIKFKFLPATHRELNLMRSDLETNVSAISLNDKQIQAAIISGKLDDFTSTYYKNMLEHREGTLHPAKILDKSISILDAKGVVFYNRELFKEEEEPEEFKDKISSYNQYQIIKNEARIERGLEARLAKSIDRVVHDVTLREMILKLRNKEEFQTSVHISECKVYGLTIDKGLLEFDRSELRKQFRSSEFIPTFFLPSYLLKRMFRYLPVQSDDYKKSFISAISSPIIISKDKDSKVAQLAIKHLRAMGIDDTELIINSLTSDIFLSNIQKLDDNEEKIEEFIESEINRSIKQKALAIEKGKAQLQKIESRLKTTGEFSQQVIEQNNILKEDKNLLENNVTVLTAGLEQLNKQLKKASKASRQDAKQAQLHIPYQDPKDIAIKELKDQISALSSSEKAKEETLQKLKQQKIKDYKALQLKKWQRKPIIGLAIFILVLLILVALSFYSLDWSINNAILIFKEHESNKLIGLVVAGVFGIVSLIIAYFVKMILMKNEPKNIDGYLNQIDVPENL